MLKYAFNNIFYYAHQLVYLKLLTENSKDSWFAYTKARANCVQKADLVGESVLLLGMVQFGIIISEYELHFESVCGKYPKGNFKTSGWRRFGRPVVNSPKIDCA
jgi:hypothetical protein